MSGITGTEDISLAKKSATDAVQGTTALVFAHEALGGETGLDLTSLTTPASLSSNGFANPSPSQIAAADILYFRKNLRLYSSLSGRLHDYDSYIVTSSTRITFLSYTLSPGEIIKGEISDVQRTGTLTADGRYRRVTYELPVGQTVVPLGVTFKVNDQSTVQGSSVRVYRNGVRQVRNTGNAAASPSADGNYQEIDAGNGYGVSIQMNTAPSGSPDVIDVDLGLYVTDGSAEIFSSIERIAGIMYSMANDLALATGNPVTNYMAASLSEIERVTYAAMVLNTQARVATLENIANTYLNVVSSVATPSSSGIYVSMTGNSITIPAGQEWDLCGAVEWSNAGANPGYSYVYGLWSTQNGNNDNVEPPIPGLLAGSRRTLIHGVSGAAYGLVPLPTIRVGPGTYYLVPYAEMTTPANARVATFIYAKRVK